MSRLAAVAVPILALAAACSMPTSTTSTPSASPTVTSTAVDSTNTPSATAAPTPSTTAAEQVEAKTRSKAALTKALLSLDDLPSGFAVEPDVSDQGNAPTVSSKDPKCASFVKYANADSAPGSVASATASFSGGQDGPFIDEYLGALRSPTHVADLHAKMKAAVAACPTVTLTLPGAGKSTMLVRSVKAPVVGDSPLAFRITADGGDLDGFEITQVLVGVGDVELTLVFGGAYPDEIEGATQMAHEKAASKLGVSTRQLSS